MKRPLAFTFLFSICCVSIFGQLSKDFNCIRIGDVLVKQQVEYKNPGSNGINIFWDFSKLKEINEEYKITYSKPSLQGDSIYIMGDYVLNKKQVNDSDLIVATEHNTMYYFIVTNDSLFQLGHENSSVKLTNSLPVLLLPRSMSKGQIISTEFEIKGTYSGSEQINSRSKVKSEIDAYGKMILPSGDTLSSVLRLKTSQVYFEIQDSFPLVIPKNEIETYRWYAKGYRYPIFETVRNINLKDSTEIFATAFLFPPQEHYYLDNDPKNMALLDSIWNANSTNSFSIDSQTSHGFTRSYSIYPNPVENQLTVEFKTKGKSDASVILYSSTGKIYKKIDKLNLTTGYYTETINCSDLPSGIYLIKIITGDQIITNKIIKK